MQVAPLSARETYRYTGSLTQQGGPALVSVVRVEVVSHHPGDELIERCAETTYGCFHGASQPRRVGGRGGVNLPHELVVRIGACRLNLADPCEVCVLLQCAHQCPLNLGMVGGAGTKPKCCGEHSVGDLDRPLLKMVSLREQTMHHHGKKPDETLMRAGEACCDEKVRELFEHRRLVCNPLLDGFFLVLPTRDPGAYPPVPLDGDRMLIRLAGGRVVRDDLEPCDDRRAPLCGHGFDSVLCPAVCQRLSAHRDTPRPTTWAASG